MIGSSSKLSPMSAGNLSLKTPIRSTTPKNNLPSPAWSKGCLRPHSPLRPRQQGALGSHSSTTSGTNIMGSPVPSSGSGGGSSGMSDPSMTPNESGSNRTLKRFMTMKKSKANEFLKRGNEMVLSIIEFLHIQLSFSLVETSEGDSLLLSVIEAYCIPNVSSGTAIANLNTLISKTRNSVSATGRLIFNTLKLYLFVCTFIGISNTSHLEHPSSLPSAQTTISSDHSNIPLSSHPTNNDM